MCEILVYNKDRLHADATKDRLGSYKRGMPVIVYEDGHAWGRMESRAEFIASGLGATSTWPADFVILKIPLLPVAAIADIQDEQRVDDAGAPVSPLLLRHRRRGWLINLDGFPPNILTDLADNGEATITNGLLNSNMTRIRDGASHPGLV